MNGLAASLNDDELRFGRPGRQLEARTALLRPVSPLGDQPQSTCLVLDVLGQ